ncbi:MAG: DNRLRE domain-containing protein [Planctomycetota bacterium]|jgi:hypothetical protein
MKKVYSYIISAAFILFITQTTVSSTTITLYPTDDAYIKSSDPNTNYGSETDLTIGKIGGTIYRAYLKFNLSTIPEGKLINSARVRLNAHYVSTSAALIRLHNLNDDNWNELIITWNNASTDYSTQSIDSPEAFAAIGDNYWVVTRFADNAHRDDGIYSVVLKNYSESSERYANFYSKECATESLRPFLEIEYVDSKYSGGMGEPNDPYIIATAADLNDIANHMEDYDQSFILANDIDLSEYTGSEFNIIGDGDFSFKGVFDGNDYTITNFSYFSTDGPKYIGIFGYIGDPYSSDAPGGNNFVVKNLHLTNVDINVPSSQEVGSIVGYNEGRIEGCSSSGKVIGRTNCGFITGYNWYGSIEDCYSDGTVEGKWNIGGIAGVNFGTIRSCYSLCQNRGSEDVGGLCGSNGGTSYGDGVIENCFSAGSVEGYNDPDNSFYNGRCIGGLIGDNRSICNSGFSNANVCGIRKVGGFIGYNASEITNSYACGNVSGEIEVGGFIGYNREPEITHCYSTGIVDGNDLTGGFIGTHLNGTYDKCFWDSSLAADVNGIGDATDPNVIALPSNQMKMVITYTAAGWDLANTWVICENSNYPRLQWQILQTDLICPDGVNFKDYSYFVNGLDANDPNCDFDDSGNVTSVDLKIFYNDWLKGILP